MKLLRVNKIKGALVELENNRSLFYARKAIFTDARIGEYVIGEINGKTVTNIHKITKGVI